MVLHATIKKEVVDLYSLTWKDAQTILLNGLMKTKQNKTQNSTQSMNPFIKPSKGSHLHLYSGKRIQTWK